MPRANRYILPGFTYHVTHRCHNQSFLFRFALDRNAYRKMLRERLQSFPISLLTYCITSNHTHLLLRVREGREETLARFMQSLEGDFAQHYNIRKKRNGAFWGDRYHAVMIDNGPYLWNCLKYIDLNMVRAGVVRHPREWNWCGCQELLGLKKRNRLVDMEGLLRWLGDGVTLAGFRNQYASSLEEALAVQDLNRDARWTESLAVGGREFVEEVGRQIPNRMEVVTEQLDDNSNTWIVREARDVWG
jgi:putative transposase